MAESEIVSLAQSVNEGIAEICHELRRLRHLNADLLAALQSVSDVTRFYTKDHVEIPASEWGKVIATVEAAIAEVRR